jgi:hypothetical protein
MRLASLALLAACTTPTSAPFLPVDQAAPPELTATALVEGERATITLTGVPTGTDVQLYVSASLGTSCPGGLNGTCLDLAPLVTRILRRTAPRSGEVGWTGTIPAGTGLTELHIQAAGTFRGRTYTSPVVSRTVLGPDGDEDGDGLSNRIEAQRGSDPTATDTDGDACPDLADRNPTALTDADGDGIDDSCDICPTLADEDADANGIADCLEDPCAQRDPVVWLSSEGDQALYRHDVDAGTTHRVGDLPSFLADVAFGPDGRLWGHSFAGELFHVDPWTAELTQVWDGADIGRTVNAMAIDRHGRAWLAGGSDLYRVDLDTFEVVQLLDEAAPDLASSGDITFVDDAVQVTMRRPSDGSVVLATFADGGFVEGPALPENTYGIARVSDGEVYLFARGDVHSFDPASGGHLLRGTVLPDGSGNVAGAASLAEACAFPEDGVAFATSTTHDGALGGLARADAICQAEADAAGLTGTFLAWLSDSTTHAPDRLLDHARAYTLADGAPLTTWSALLDGALSSPIGLDASGEDATQLAWYLGTNLWTGTTADGLAQSATCQDWTSSDPADFGTTGRNNFGDASWTEDLSAPCDQALQLYCFES